MHDVFKFFVVVLFDYFSQVSFGYHEVVLFSLIAIELPLEMVVSLSDMEVEDLTEVVLQCQCSQDDVKPIWKKVISGRTNVYHDP